MRGLLNFVLMIWIFAGISFVSGLLESDVSFGEAIGNVAPLLGIWGAVGVAAISWLITIGMAEVREEKRWLRGLVERRDYAWGEVLQLGAPEAILLLRDGEANPGEVFEAGVMQGVAAGGLYTDDDHSEPDGDAEAARGSTDPGQVADRLPIVGSVEVLTGGEGVRTGVKACVERMKAEYGSPAGFVEREVAPRLVRAGYWSEDVGLTGSGVRARAVLEGRVGAALYDLEAQGGPSIEEDRKRALLAAVVLVSAGMPMREAVEGAEEAGNARIGDLAITGVDVMSDLMLSWFALDAFDHVFADISSAVGDAGFGGGDGGEGGDGGDGGGGE